MKMALVLITAAFLGLRSPQAAPSGAVRQQPVSPSGACSEMLSASMMHMHEAMATVKTTGQFDSDFMKLMIPHHEAALEMAKAELLCGKDPAARRLAQEIIADQTSEIDLMKLLLKQGSGQHNNTPAPSAKEVNP
jgi:uncharacterized protein (DUF305 family)